MLLDGKLIIEYDGWFGMAVIVLLGGRVKIDDEDAGRGKYTGGIRGLDMVVG